MQSCLFVRINNRFELPSFHIIDFTHLPCWNQTPVAVTVTPGLLFPLTVASKTSAYVFLAVTEQVSEIMTVPFPDALQESIIFSPCFNVIVMAISSFLLPLLYLPTQYAVVPEIRNVGLPEIALRLTAADAVVTIIDIIIITTTIRGKILFRIKTPPSRVRLGIFVLMPY